MTLVIPKVKALNPNISYWARKAVLEMFLSLKRTCFNHFEVKFIEELGHGVVFKEGIDKGEEIIFIHRGRVKGPAIADQPHGAALICDKKEGGAIEGQQCTDETLYEFFIKVIPQ